MIWLLLISALLIWIFWGRGKAPEAKPYSDVETRLSVRNQEWAQFIASYLTLAKTKSEKELLARMLNDISTQGIAVPAAYERETSVIVPDQAPGMATKPAAQTLASKVATEQQAKNQVQLDNASLLLYFGAFLFVASAGLFVAFGGLPGGVRTFIVILVTFIMYGSGVWLTKNRHKLQQAGLAFAGIGIAIAPLVGLTMYKYVFAESNASAIWFITSLLCLGLYAHALIVLRKPLINYLFIFTFLSLFESGVSITSAPVYYFGWVMALAGIILTVVSRRRGIWPELQESSKISGMLFLPIALITSAALISTQGTGQLGVSLLLAAAYYGLQAMSTAGGEQLTNAVVTQVALTAAVGALSYALAGSFETASIAIFAFNGLETLVLIATNRSGVLWRNFASVILVAQLIAVLVGVEHVGMVLAASAGFVAMAGIMWWLQRRTDSYVVAIVGWTALPVIFGQVFVSPHVSTRLQAALLLGSLLLQFLLLTLPERRSVPKTWRPAAQQVFAIGCLAVIAASVLSTAWFCLLICSLVTVLTILVAEKEHNPAWATVIGLFAAAPLLRVWNSPGAFLAAVVIALLINIYMALRHREEATRWFSTLLWLLLPVAMGSGILGQNWGLTAYAWAYVIATLGLVFSRAIARGVVFVSGKIPLTSYARTASVSYVFGYSGAAGLAIILSLLGDGGQTNATLILGFMCLVVWVLARYVEKRSDLLVLIPLLLQAMLWSAIRPELATSSIIIYLILSSMLAALTYAAAVMRAKPTSLAVQTIQTSGLIAVFITPLTFFVINQTLWPMPLGLLVAGCIVYYHVRMIKQSYRELAGGLILASVWWLMWFYGVTAAQAYSHALVALLAVYAYWRHQRSEETICDQYLGAMLTAATIPLVIQALGGQAGGLYGWWLLLEEIGFMIIGMAIGKRFLTRWGLYIAVAAVLYQLRNLGWAALTVLALFLIGLAVAKILKYQEK